MKTRRRISRIAAVLAGCLICLSGGTVMAEQVYHTYSYDYWGQAFESPALYLPSDALLGTDMQTTALKEPQDLFVQDATGRVYLSDTGNNRILILDNRLQLIREICQLDIPAQLMENTADEKVYSTTFLRPTGLYVTSEGLLYIADTDNKRVVVCDEYGTVQQIIASPKGNLQFTGIDFLPTRLVVDNSGYVYLLCRGVYHGALVFTPAGEFEGYFGANDTEVTFQLLMDRMWKRFFSAEQRDQLANYVPVEFSNLDIDENGFIYTCTMISRTGEDNIKKFNFAGENVLTGNPLIKSDYQTYYGDPETVSYSGVVYQTKLTDICYNNGYMMGLDLQRGRIFQYDKNGHLLGAFGSIGTQLGNFHTPAAIDFLEDRLLVLDSGKGCITRFSLTEYGRLLQQADESFIAGRYADAKEEWQQILKQNNRCQLAWIGLGKALFEEADYTGALACFKQGQDRVSYGLAFQEIRDRNLQRYLPYLVIGALAVIGAVWLLSRFKKSKPKRERFRQWSWVWYTMCHPIKGFTQCLEKKTGFGSFGLLLSSIFFVALIIQRQFTGFSFNYNEALSINVLFLLAQSVVLLFSWSLANWSVTTLLDGKGSFKRIWYVSNVSILPYIAVVLINTVLSNLLVPAESMFMTAILLVGILWSLLLLWSGLSVIHEYSFGKTLGSMLLTLLMLLIVLFILVLFFSLFQQTLQFVLDIYNELSFRQIHTG